MNSLEDTKMVFYAWAKAVFDLADAIGYGLNRGGTAAVAIERPSDGLNILRHAVWFPGISDEFLTETEQYVVGKINEVYMSKTLYSGTMPTEYGATGYMGALTSEWFTDEIGSFRFIAGFSGYTPEEDTLLAALFLELIRTALKLNHVAHTYKTLAEYRQACIELKKYYVWTYEDNRPDHLRTFAAFYDPDTGVLISMIEIQHWPDQEDADRYDEDHHIDLATLNATTDQVLARLVFRMSQLPGIIVHSDSWSGDENPTGPVAEIFIVCTNLADDGTETKVKLSIHLRTRDNTNWHPMAMPEVCPK